MLISTTRHNQTDMIVNEIMALVLEPTMNPKFVDSWVFHNPEECFGLSDDGASDQWMTWCAFDGI